MPCRRGSRLAEHDGLEGFVELAAHRLEPPCALVFADAADGLHVALQRTRARAAEAYLRLSERVIA